MDFTLSPEAIAYRDLVRSIIADTVTNEAIEDIHRTGTFDLPALNFALAKHGLLERAVPGMGKGDPIELWILFNELEKAGAPYDGIAVSLMIAGVVNAVGTDEQKQRIIPSIVSGEAGVCMGYSEPDYGSDVASIVTRAVRDGDQWVINGAKMWTTMAHVAKWLILLTRTDTDLPKHRGLTMFILPMDTPGITVKPVHTMASEHTNATWYDDVCVGDEAVLGEVNGGWRTMTVALAFERGVMGGTNQGVPLLTHFAEWVKQVGLASDPAVKVELAKAAIDMHVSTLLTQRAAWIAASGGLPGLEGSMAKLFATEAYQREVRSFQNVAAQPGLLGFHEDGAAAEGFIDYDARHSPVTTIYGGTSEIQRNNIAERHLGLPRNR